MAGTRRLIQLTESALDRCALPDGDLVVALSGGADSAALGWLVKTSGRPSRCLHVDHGLKGSSRLRQAATDVARQLQQDLQVAQVEVDKGASPEERARVARYRAFADATHPTESILTAHTKEDDVETVLINLVRGTGLRGLAGIPPYRPPNIHRPLLDVSRSETRELAMLAGLGFVDDPMNLDPTLARTHVRTRLLPVLAERNPSVVEAIAGMAKTLRADADFLDSLVPGPRVADDSIRFPAGALLALPRALADRALLAALADVGAPVGRDQLTRIWSVIEGGSSRQQLGGGLVAELSGPMLHIGLEPS